ncbi:MAG: adenylyl-sulfate kinase [Candidatus Moranbacteria bacterium]|nr:adenylyl-sulfate kinase [Candidatus Moranbacteria bacterium]
MKNQQGFVLWLTGLSGAGKTTTGKAIYEKLKQKGYKIELLDGDKIRENLTQDLGFSKKDRNENIKRVSFVAGLLSNHQIGVIACFISPYKKQRQMARNFCKNFVEIHINTPLNICEKRDIKGLYEKARKGEIQKFTGIDDPYEEPKKPDLVLDGSKKEKIKQNSKIVIDFLKEKKYI